MPTARFESDSRLTDARPDVDNKSDLMAATGAALADQTRQTLAWQDEDEVRGPGMVEEVTRLATSGRCCFSFPLEAILFGVLMPLSVAGYWFYDAVEDHNALGGPWLQASCMLHDLNVVPRLIYHHGKFKDAKDARNQDGFVYKLEPSWNVTVELDEPHPDGLWEREVWDGVAYTTVLEAHRPICSGQVLESLQEAVSDCSPYSDWVPQYALDSPVDCFVHARDESQVYLDVAEPLTFYLDLLAIVACVVLAATFATCIWQQHCTSRRQERQEAEARGGGDEEALRRLSRGAMSRVMGSTDGDDPLPRWFPSQDPYKNTEMM